MCHLQLVIKLPFICTEVSELSRNQLNDVLEVVKMDDNNDQFWKFFNYQPSEAEKNCQNSLVLLEAVSELH